MAFPRFASSIINFFGLIKVILVVIVTIVLIVVLFGVPLPVSGQSMEPNFHNSQIVLVKRLSFAGTITRGDVVAAAFPADSTHTKLIKRVIGLPGDTVSFDDFGHVTLNGNSLTENYKPNYGELPSLTINNVTLKSGEYFLMGDNRPGSSDSRIWGPVQQNDIQGKVRFIVWPLSSAQYVDTPIYN